MGEQLGLPVEMLSHTTDEDTSKAAIAAMTKSGKRASHLRAVLRTFAANPDLTDAEAAVLLAAEFDLTETRRRASDLRGAGMLEKVFDGQGTAARRPAPPELPGTSGMVCKISAAGLAAVANLPQGL